VSRELTHFVGSGLRNPSATPAEIHERQYRLLVAILRKGILGQFSDSNYVVTFSGGGRETKLSSNKKYSGQMVCFCDIPVEDLPLHMKKYSQFGLAFSKDFLTCNGATPLLYVCENSLVKNTWNNPSSVAECNRLIPLREVFDNYDEDWYRLVDVKPRNQTLSDMHVTVQRLLHSHLKFFDSMKNEDDNDHFYMEREWRVMGTVRFTLDDIVRVILPPSFAKRLRQDLPEYCAQLTFSAEAI
jgi:hypothetical protein